MRKKKRNRAVRKQKSVGFLLPHKIMSRKTKPKPNPNELMAIKKIVALLNKKFVVKGMETNGGRPFCGIFTNDGKWQIACCHFRLWGDDKRVKVFKKSIPLQFKDVMDVKMVFFWDAKVYVNRMFKLK